ncbi:MAG: hypothetical protein K0Q55_1378 [Verrucomicrobia bacterium]|jgi:hypothetical protein|nr:hypothetical protein [Verrucomicrobiota bacterium]
MTLRYLTLLTALLATLIVRPAAAQTNTLSAGPLAHTFPLTLQPGHRFETLGPLFYRQQSESNTLWAIPPLIAHTTDPDMDMTEMDILYPLLSYDRFGAEYRFHILQVFAFAGGKTLDKEVEKNRFTLFPFYFQQRSPDPVHNYTALFPLYGTLKNRLFRDEIFFVAFPLYGQSRKKDVVTDNYVYPFFHLRKGDNLSGWQFWPIFGHEFKGMTTKTNGFGEVEPIPAHDKWFALWPIYHHNDVNLGTDNPQKIRILLPLYSIYQSPLRDSYTFPWPLGFTYTDDREKKYHEYGLPWPLIVFARGEKTVNRIWPLFGKAKNSFKQSDFYLWPVWKYNRIQSAPLDRERTRIMFFLYSDLIERNTDTGKHLRRVDFWPFFTSRKGLDDKYRLQIFAPLEPMLPNNKSIERSYSPLWSVWRTERNPKTEASSHSLLWNLYRKDKSPEQTKCSLLFGLFQYQSTPEARQYRLFYIPLGKKANGPKPAVQEGANSKP